MPPSGHSSSSHSSRSSGSSRSSSSHSSSSSRSSSSHSSSSFRSSSSSRSSSSYSSRSSSSRSSSGFAGSRIGASRGPSPHSGTSRTSRPTASNSSRSYGSRPATTPPQRRPRVNQPMGFRDSGSLQPRYYYGRRHDYVYYPMSWVDPNSGTSYEKGYYDENGKYYDSVAFQENGGYSNVACRCPYCGTETLLNLDNNVGSQQELKCPSCGAPMEILSELDEIVAGRSSVNTSDYFNPGTSTARERSSYDPEIKEPSRKKAWRFALFAVILGLLISAGRYFANRSEHPPAIQEEPSLPAVQIIQGPGSGIQITPTEPVYLELQEDGYHVVNDPVRADKYLFWDADADSWYDYESDCWLWFNTDVEPPLWQYWYEGISSDYGDYGWMEHGDDGWYIERADGDWIPVPDHYNTEDLWYIEG